MKILKKGREQAGSAKEYDCTGAGNGGGGCGSRLLVEEGDVFETHSSALGESDYYYTFSCAACDVLTDIPDTEVPVHIRRALMDERVRAARKSLLLSGEDVWAATALVDLDGTIFKHGTNELLPGALEDMQRLEKKSVRIVYITRRDNDEFGRNSIYSSTRTVIALKRLARSVSLPFHDLVLFGMPSPRIVIDDHPGLHIHHTTNTPVQEGEYSDLPL